MSLTECVATVPDDYDMLKEWFPVIRHARAVAKQNLGLAVVTLRVIVDERGQPAGLWAMPSLTKLAPKMTAAEALTEIIRALQKD